ncbi:MAG: hypothetical protein M3R71_03610, partial [Actinomycetota bacterium]|nr:hypothetical protein [Actinomycetota bacterium]
AGMLRQLQSRTVGAKLVGVRDTSHRQVLLAELDFAGGTSVCLGDCHPPTIVSLARRAARETLILQEVAHHGPYWGFYFINDRNAHFPVLAVDAHFLQDEGRGGTRRLAGAGPHPSPLVSV